MALGIRKPPKQEANGKAWMENASQDAEATLASEQDACWLELIQQAINLAEQPRYQTIEINGTKKNVLMGKKLWKLKTAAEYANMDPSEIHPAVLIQVGYLIRNG